LLNQRVIVLAEGLPFYNGSNIVDKIFHQVILINECPGSLLYWYRYFDGCLRLRNKE
jgi:hypothetical protein